MTVIPFAVDRSGTISARLYPGEKEGEYFTDAALTRPYIASEDITVKEYGWAAIPVDADWKAGKRYVYTLNYSEGVGVHDPDDPLPGKPILDRGKIQFKVSVLEWLRTDEDNSDINVPKH